MKIGYKLIILFSILIVAAVATSSGIAFQSVEESVIDSEIQNMISVVNFKENEIQTLHSRASENLIFAVQNTIFIDYFELIDTRAGNIYDEKETMIFTLPQQVLVDKLQKWMFNFQSQFSADAISIIDRTGQEHIKFTFQELTKNADLSSEKDTAPFFEPSFQLEKDKVHFQFPYFSTDSKRLVFAYTTPIVITDNTKPAFLQIEMPISLFQELVSVDVGRMYVLDPKGFIIADSNNISLANVNSNINFDSKSNLDPQEFFSSVQTLNNSLEFNDLVQEMYKNSEGTSTYSEDGEDVYVAYKQMATFGWILVYEKPYSVLLQGENNLNSLRAGMAIIAAVISVGGLFAVFVVSSRITKPINKLASECTNQNPAKLKKVTVSTKDELSDVSTSINNMIERVNKMEKQKEEFSSMITHELKTPLTPIIGWCQTLQNPKILGSLNEKQSKAIDTIVRNAKRLQMMIGDVLDAQKLDMNKMKFDYKDISVNEFLEYLHSNLQHVMKPKNIEYIKNITGELKIHSDKNRLEQVFNNLIFNAVDFVPDENGRIEVSARDNGDSVLFHVKDNGAGIPKNKQKDLFKKFYQVNTTLARKHGGTGLGLSVSKGIIEGLGGKISVESDEGKGSDFQFTVPKKSQIWEKQKE
jgi:signal transduction histidine kinase